MAANSYGSQGQPHFAATGGNDTAGDLTLLADYAALVGNTKVGTTTQMNALTGSALWTGLLFVATDTGILYFYSGSAWVQIGPAGARFKGTITTSKAIGATNKWGISTGPTFDSTDDPLSCFSATTGLFTAKVAGTYIVMAQAKSNTSGFAASGSFTVLKNGTAALVSPNSGTAQFSGVSLIGYVRLAVNDTISISFNVAYTTQTDSPADNNYFELVQVSF